MHISKLRVPKKMRVTSFNPGKLKGMKVAKRIKAMRKINVTKKLKRSFNKGTPTVTDGSGAGVGGGRVVAPQSGTKWISMMRKKIMRPKFPHRKGTSKNNNNNSKNIIIIHNNTSITSNDEDNRTSCVTCVEVKEIATLKEEDVTSIDSAAPPANDQASKEDETDDEQYEEAEQEDIEEEEVDEEEEEEYKEKEEEKEEKQVEDMEIVRLREEKASILIQSVFRGHLARRAFTALKSLVKLQAVVRGACVRRQARIALHCMNTLVRLQVRVQARQRVSTPSSRAVES